jgi:DNA invertase Pin-like site-specific DNA recombinase/phage FluMu protein Com
MEDKKFARIIGYARVSTSRQANNGYNLDEQCKRIDQYVELFFDKGKYSLEIYRDAGASAKNLDRREMSKIMKMAKNKEFDILVIHNLDRLTRKVVDLGRLLTLFQENDIKLISIQERFDMNTTHGKLIANVLSSVAEWELETIRTRTQRAIIEAAEEGKYPKPRAPFGYRRDPEDNSHLIIREDQAEIVRHAFQIMIDGSMTEFEYALKLKQEKALGRKWCDKLLYKMIRNKIYYGTLELYGKDYPDCAPVIISKSDFAKANAMRSKSRTTVRHNYIYKNVARCSKCGSYLTLTCTTNSRGQVFLYYKCPTCNKSINQNLITEQVEPLFSDKLQEVKYKKDMVKIQQQYHLAKSQIKRLSYAYVKYCLDEETVSELVLAAEMNKGRLETDMQKLKRDVQTVNFMDLSRSERIDFYREYVDNISINFKSKDAKIHWKK